MTKTFWLSFCDNDRPAGQRFLGVAVVDVTRQEAEDAALEVAIRFPKAEEGSAWVAAAAKKAWATGCNPGGEIASMEMPREWPAFDTCPRHVLLTKHELEHGGW